jgi:hypothetical protein
MGDACEMLVAAELTLAGVPAMIVPAHWPDYDVIAQPTDGRPLQRISVKSRMFKRGSAFADYDVTDEFHWLAIVLIFPRADQSLRVQRRIFIVPKHIADQRARKYSPTSKVAHVREFRVDEVEKILGEFEHNYRLSPTGSASEPGK